MKLSVTGQKKCELLIQGTVLAGLTVIKTCCKYKIPETTLAGESKTFVG